MSGWWDGLSPQVQAALVAAGTAVFTTLVTLFGKELFETRARQRQRSVESYRVYQRYADPIVVAATSLLWRLKEVVEDGRAGYLVGEGRKPEFQLYKVRSTLYRLAAVLAWLRALDRELFQLRLPDPTAVREIDDARRRFRDALADGVAVEQRRLQSLVKLWSMDAVTDPGALDRLGSNLDSLIERFLFASSLASPDALPPGTQRDLCLEASNLLGEACTGASVAEDKVLRSVPAAIEAITIREAWLYADWQTGIGDMMLRDSASGERHYEVIGFREFEALLRNGSDEDRLWARRLYSVLDGLDVSAAERDARVDQLRATYIATAGLIRALESVKGAEIFVTQRTQAQIDRITSGPSD